MELIVGGLTEVVTCTCCWGANTLVDTEVPIDGETELGGLSLDIVAGVDGGVARCWPAEVEEEEEEKGAKD